MNTTPTPVRPSTSLRRVATHAALFIGLAMAWPAWAASPFTVNGDGTVTDSSTGLMWDQCSYGLSGSACETGTALRGTWSGALAAAVTANAASYKGFTDWRVPNKNELESLEIIDSFNPSIDAVAFPGTPTNDYFWTSTSYAPAPVYAWLVSFAYGEISATYKASARYVRLVRSGQSDAAFDGQPTGLPDTGQSNCYNDSVADSVAASNPVSIARDSGSHPRQDCRYGRDAAAAAAVLPKTGGGAKGFDYSKISNTGVALAASATLGSAATDWACTMDNITGLMWEVKTTSGLRSVNNTYSWYNSSGAANGGNAGTATNGICTGGSGCDTEKFVADVNAAVLCGFTDWRMPSQRELLTLVYADRSSPSIDPTYFPNTQGTFSISYWSGSSYVPSATSASSVDFFDGVARASVKVDPFTLVRLVRGGPF